MTYYPPERCRHCGSQIRPAQVGGPEFKKVGAVRICPRCDAPSPSPTPPPPTTREVDA